MIQLKDLSVGYGRRRLLSEISATFEAGNLTALIGRNGSGKSTLLKTMARLNDRYSGTIM
ncbi:MAG: ATP-binding cassette domain-containing protein, partial [Muribaculaceae bacterium]|nr:ATP-binding cassette domain-containing protein [Muribaculaceae bacterium]